MKIFARKKKLSILFIFFIKKLIIMIEIKCTNSKTNPISNIYRKKFFENNILYEC